MKKIIDIQKSYKHPGYAMIKVEGKSEWVMRKCYERKTGMFKGLQLINLDCDIYSFKWENEAPLSEESQKSYKAVNITWVGNYKSIEEAVVDKQVQRPVVKAEVKPEIVVVEDEDGQVKHEKFLQIKTCVDNNIPVYLVGPAGSGKNHTLEQIADELGLDFYFTNSVQQEFKLTGFIDAGGNYHETEFYKAFKNGGLFFLDEMDASIPEVLVLLNAAIANRYFEFPTGKINAHKNFRVVSAGNTVGNGADEQYTGRLQLDQATLDRFAIIDFDYSMKIEMHLAKGNADLVTFIRELRQQAKDKGIRATFSYRCITMVQKLEGKLALTDIMGIAVFKGFDKDTLRTFRANGYTKYHQSMKELIGA